MLCKALQNQILKPGLMWWGVFSNNAVRDTAKWYFPGHQPNKSRAEQLVWRGSTQLPFHSWAGMKGPFSRQVHLGSGLIWHVTSFLFLPPRIKRFSTIIGRTCFPVCTFNFIYFFNLAPSVFSFFLDWQGLAAPSGDVDLVGEKKCACCQAQERSEDWDSLSPGDLSVSIKQSNDAC